MGRDMQILAVSDDDDEVFSMGSQDGHNAEITVVEIRRMDLQARVGTDEPFGLFVAAVDLADLTPNDDIATTVRMLHYAERIPNRFLAPSTTHRSCEA